MNDPIVLLTGATGFIGSHLLESLLKNNIRVIILKRSNSNIWRIEEIINKCITINIDTDDIESVFVKYNIDVIFHLATSYRKFESLEDQEEMIYSNIKFPTLLLELSNKYKIKGFINTGTFFEYDHSCPNLNEETPLKPFNFYAKNKIDFEKNLISQCKHLNAITLKLFTPYGEKDNENKLIPHIINSAIAGKPLFLSEGLQKLDFIYVKDIVDAYMRSFKLLMNEHKDLGTYQVFNIGSGTPLSIKEFVSLIEKHLGYKIEITWGERKAGEVSISASSISAANKQLNWYPTLSHESGILNTVNYYLKLSKKI